MKMVIFHSYTKERRRDVNQVAYHKSTIQIHCFRWLHLPLAASIAKRWGVYSPILVLIPWFPFLCTIETLMLSMTNIIIYP